MRCSQLHPWLLSVLATLVAALSVAAASGPFEFDSKSRMLAVTTASLQFTIQGGAVVALRNLRTGEVLSSGATWEELDKASIGAVCGQRPELPMKGRSQPAVARKPQPSSSVTFTRVSSREGLLGYKGLSNGPAEDELRFRFRSEDAGELSFRLEMRMSDPSFLASDVYLPFVKLTPAAVILGSGERFARNDPAVADRCMRIANNLYSPPVAVIEGAKGVIGMWPEPTSYGYDDMVVSHKPASDEVIPQVCLAFNAKDPETASEPGLTRSSWWRLASLPSWRDVARRYRANLEKRTGVKPLWLHSPTWVRNIHAVCMERPNTTDEAQADEFYADLASKLDPRKLLLFYWNGNCILLFGDHRYMPNFQYPKPQEIAALKRQGFRWIGYHPYVLLFSPKGMAPHLEEAKGRGFGVPEGYAFQPDYAGPLEAEKFYDYFRPVAAGYYAKLEESTGLWTLHPGAKLTREYLARNFGNYCRAHDASGCYLDILGADHAGQCLENAPEDRRIMEGNDWRRGEELACRAMKEANPDLALMSEVQGEWTTVHTFYTWEGETHLTHPNPVRLNHPMRAACWGSYTWTRWEGCDNPEALALMAGLPPARLADEWSLARAKLYTEEELFHDLPEKWDPEALAYYRGKGGRWFQYRKMPWGYAYVEATPKGPQVRLGRLVNQSIFPVLNSQVRNPQSGIRIQNCLGYRDGIPIGLNPARTYNFMMEAPKPEGKLWVTDLPKGVFISAVRPSDTQTVLELGSTSAERAGTVKVLFHGKCLGVADAAKDYPGPFQADSMAEFTTPMPGGLVFQWQEPKPVDPRFTGSFIGPSGHLHANGLPYSWWTYNASVRSTTFALDVKAPAAPVVELGTGLHRAWTDQWVDLAAGAKPVLRFDLGYSTSEDPKQPPPRPLAWSVRLNGKEVWREEVKPDPSWRARGVDLSPFAGRRALVTLSAEELSDSDVLPTYTLTPARFGNARITDNPLPEVRPEGSALPPLGRVLFEDRFRGHTLDAAWATAISPAHAKEGRIAPEDGRLAFTGQHYKYEYISRPFPPEADAVQALLEVRPTGCSPRWNPGLGLWWGANRWAFVSFGGDAYAAELAGWGCRQLPFKGMELPVWQERFYGWVKIKLAADKVVFSLSTDAKTWTERAEFPREKQYAGPPQLLLLGRGIGGAGQVFSNDERWETGVTTCYLGELVVGKG